MAITQELIDRINVLAKKKKTGTISDAELVEQKELREIYLSGFRKNMNAVLANVDVLKEMGISKLHVKPHHIELMSKDQRIMRIEKAKTEYIVTYKVREIQEHEILEILKK
ncbi:MAG: DUF896 domain-containing protein [Mycoplasmatales bacterium]